MKQSDIKDDRRRFIKGMAVAGGAAAVAVTTGNAAAKVAEPGAQAPEAQAASSGYRVSQHVLDYYKTARS
jgi:nitrous oxide reductase